MAISHRLILARADASPVCGHGCSCWCPSGPCRSSHLRDGFTLIEVLAVAALLAAIAAVTLSAMPTPSVAEQRQQAAAALAAWDARLRVQARRSGPIEVQIDSRGNVVSVGVNENQRTASLISSSARGSPRAAPGWDSSVWRLRAWTADDQRPVDRWLIDADGISPDLIMTIESREGASEAAPSQDVLPRWLVHGLTGQWQVGE